VAGAKKLKKRRSDGKSGGNGIKKKFREEVKIIGRIETFTRKSAGTEKSVDSAKGSLGS